MSSPNLAARAGRWSAKNWKTAIALWVAFVVVSVALGTTVGTHTLTASEQATGEAARAEQLLGSAGFDTPAAESVIVRSDSRTVADPAFRLTVHNALAKLRPFSQQPNLRS